MDQIESSSTQPISFSDLSPHLTTLILNFSASTKISLNRCQLLLPNLKNLILTNCDLMQRGLQDLPRSLVTFKLAKSTGIKDIDLQDLPEGLTSLTLSECSGFSNEIWWYLPKGLKELHIINCDGVTKELIKNLPRNLIVEFGNSKEV